MTEQLFWYIVWLFKAICHSTGLTYEALNVIVYCVLIPYSWAVLSATRLRRWLFLITATSLLAVVVVWLQSQQAFVKTFYDRQISFLYWMVSLDESRYIHISLVIGIAVPVLLYGFLIFVPRRALLPACVLMYLGLAAYLTTGWLLF
jgi:hypothetical protein